MVKDGLTCLWSTCVHLKHLFSLLKQVNQIFPPKNIFVLVSSCLCVSYLVLLFVYIIVEQWRTTSSVSQVVVSHQGFESFLVAIVDCIHVGSVA